MLNIIKINTEHVYCVGDLHGNFNAIHYFIKSREIFDSLLIFCGDIGFGFDKENYYKQVMDKMTKTCSTHRVHLIFFRGNHDDPSYFNERRIDRKWIKSVPDYTIIQRYANDDIEYNKILQTFLLVGGGVSIDRMDREAQMRKMNIDYARYHNMSFNEAEHKNPIKLYWHDELPTYNESIMDEIKENGINIDYICMHTSPSFCDPTTKWGVADWLKDDPNLENDMEYERDVADSILNKALYDGHKIKDWYNGHFHHHVTESFNGIIFHCLDMYRTTFDAVEVYYTDDIDDVYIPTNDYKIE